MESICKTASYTIFLSLLLSASPGTALGDEVDFSCMKEMVRPIIRVTDQYQEFDVVVRNWCPGDVYWAMCIERLDPWSHKVLESHTPVGYIQVDKRSRVNLQMKTTPSPDGAQLRIQEFYVNFAYSIEGPAKAACVARGCEAKKTNLRAEAAKNSRAWNRALTALEAKMDEECPDNGWNAANLETCRTAIAEASAENIAVYESADQDIRERLAAIDPENCAVHGGTILEPR